MKIILVRHGQPDAGKWNKLSGKDFSLWIDHYNAAPLVDMDNATVPIINELKDVVAQSELIICSSLRRSLDSALALNVRTDIVDSLFKEAELPIINCQWPKLSPTVWLMLCRVLWFLGKANHVESFSQMKKRVCAATSQVMTYAAEHQQIVLIGHGLFNTFLAKELLSRGLSGPKKSARGYWQFSVYEK